MRRARLCRRRPPAWWWFSQLLPCWFHVHHPPRNLRAGGGFRKPAWLVLLGAAAGLGLRARGLDPYVEVVAAAVVAVDVGLCDVAVGPVAEVDARLAGAGDREDAAVAACDVEVE